MGVVCGCIGIVHAHMRVCVIILAIMFIMAIDI